MAFNWMDGTAVEYLNWSPGEPNNAGFGNEGHANAAGEPYVEMDWRAGRRGGAWNDNNNLGDSVHSGDVDSGTWGQCFGCWAVRSCKELLAWSTSRALVNDNSQTANCQPAYGLLIACQLLTLRWSESLCRCVSTSLYLTLALWTDICTGLMDTLGRQRGPSRSARSSGRTPTRTDRGSGPR